MLEEGRGPRVSRSRGPKDQYISISNSNTSLTLKKVHLVFIYFYQFTEGNIEGFRPVKVLVATTVLQNRKY